MGRSSKSQAGENRARIVEVASALFRARGVEAVGIADVMEAAGMTQGGFYRHFPSKDALAAEACALAFAGAVENWRKVTGDARANGRDPTEAITAYYLEPKAPGMTCPMIALAADAAACGPKDLLRPAYDAGVAKLYNAFEQAMSESDGANAHARFTAMVGANLLLKATGREVGLERLA